GLPAPGVVAAGAADLRAGPGDLSAMRRRRACHQAGEQRHGPGGRVKPGAGRRRAGRAGGAAILRGLAGACLVAACAATASPTVGPVETASLGVAATGSASGVPASPVDGVLTHIDSTGLSQVTGFDMRTADGRTLAFKIGVLENGSQF